MKLSEQQALFVQDVAKLIEYIFSHNYSCTFGEAYRTPEQAAIYAKEGKGVKDSAHCKRLAVDLNIFSPQGDYLTKTESYELFGTYWESLGDRNEWGGRYMRGDGNHFQRKEL